MSLSASLLDLLGPFRLDHMSGTAPHGPGLFSYCALTRERLIAVRLPHPLLGVVLSGAKEVWSGLVDCQRFLIQLASFCWVSAGPCQAIPPQTSSISTPFSADRGFVARSL